MRSSERWRSVFRAKLTPDGNISAGSITRYSGGLPTFLGDDDGGRSFILTVRAMSSAAQRLRRAPRYYIVRSGL